MADPRCRKEKASSMEMTRGGRRKLSGVAIVSSYRNHRLVKPERVLRGQAGLGGHRCSMSLPWDVVKQVPPKLKVLEINCCRELEKLPDDLCGLTSLRKMSIADCKKLRSFPNGGLPSSLRILKLQDLPSLPHSQLISIGLLDYLEELTLWKLERLVSITELVGVGSPLSRSLRELKIRNCSSLTTLTDSLQHLSALSDLHLLDCPSLEMEIFLSLPCNLSCFLLVNCPKVKSLPHDMHHLASLKSLFIYNCQGILSLTSRGGLPPKLKVLWIEGCRNLNQPIEEWGLKGLTNLRRLGISGEMECVDEMECFPPSVYDGDWSRFLPSSLLYLTIGDMKKLERVGGGTQTPPPTHRCRAELEEKCRKGKGEYWHSHLRLIPDVDI